jgi:hypothetical protein
MTKQGADRGNTGSVLALTVLTVVLWVVALAMGVTVLVLLLRIGAPVNRTSVIVAGWFLTPAVWAVGAKFGSSSFVGLHEVGATKQTRRRLGPKHHREPLNDRLSDARTSARRSLCPYQRNGKE